MSLADIVRNGVKLAHNITKTGGLQETDVSLKRWRSEDASGVITYASTLTLSALVERKRRRVYDRDGNEIVSTTTVTILSPIPALSPAVTGRKEPVDERDSIVFGDGETGRILATDGGLKDPSTHRPYMVQVFLG